MMPTREQISAAAYARWEMNGQYDGYDIDDWLGAEQDLMLDMNYELVAECFLRQRRKEYIGARHPRRCRYCGNDDLRVPFRDEAHAIPEFLGNQSMIANDECDECNKFFSETIEDSLAKMTLPIRTVLAVRGKTGVPTHRSNDRTFRMEYTPHDPGFNVKDVGSPPVMVIDEGIGQWVAPFQCQPYIPVRILKCMTKIALAILPASELGICDQARQWILNKDDTDSLGRIVNGHTFMSILPGNLVDSWAFVFRRKTRVPMPYMIVVVGVDGLQLQSYVPLTAMDDWFPPEAMISPRSGHVTLPGDGSTMWQPPIPVASATAVRDLFFDMVFQYDVGS